MSKSVINQGDIFLCVNNVFGETYENIANILVDTVGSAVGINTPEINKLAHQKRKGFESLKDKSLEIYENLFEAHIENKSDEEKENILFLIKNCLLEELNLTFSDAFNTEKYDTCEKWVKHMLKCALFNWNTCRNPARRKNTKSFMPSLSNQTLTESKFFIGRKEISASLKEHLKKDHIVILKGMAGIGKSVIARQFAIENRNNYSYIQQLISDMPVNSEKNNVFHNLILKLNFENTAAFVGGSNSGEEEIFNAKIKMLKDIKAKTLLIFDSVDTTPADMWVLNDILKYSNVNVIITTRLTREFENFPSIILGPLNSDEQLALFEHYLGFRIDTSDDNNEDFRAVEGILKISDGNTMYIEHIAKYIKTWECSFPETLESLRKGNSLLHYWKIQKDLKTYQDESFIGSFLHILFPIPITDIRKKVLKSLALLPLNGVSRKLFFEATDKIMQNELVNLENDGYAVLEQSTGKNITRLHPMVRTVIRCEFFEDEYDCADFIEGICRIMNKPFAVDKGRDIYGITVNILDFLTLKDFEHEKISEWLNTFVNYYNNKIHRDLEFYEIKNINATIKSKAATVLNKTDTAFSTLVN